VNPQNLQTIIRDAKPLALDSTLSAYLHATGTLDEHLINSDGTLVLICEGMREDVFVMQICEQFKDDSLPCLTSFTFSEDSTLLLYKGRIYIPDYHNVCLTILHALRRLMVSELHICK
jgi:hypothetical protein